MMRELNLTEIGMASGASGTAVYVSGSWHYGNACYSSAQAAANAGATGFSVGNQYFGTSGNPFTDPNLSCESENVSCVTWQKGN